MRALACLLAAICLLLTACPALAADFPQAAAQVKKDLAQAKTDQTSSAQQGKELIATLTSQLAQLQRDTAAQETALQRAEDQLAKTRQLRVELDERLQKEQGDLKELAGLVRAHARELLALAETSPATGFNPEVLPRLRAYLNKSRFPGMDDIQALLEINFTMLAEQGRIVQQRGDFVDQHGDKAQGRLLALGPFTAIYENGDTVGYLTLGRSSGRLLALGGEPPWSVRGNLKAFLAGEEPAVFMDLSGGAALRQLSRQPSPWEQLLSGGPLIWPILLVGLISLVLILERLFFLRRVRANTDVLMDRVNRLVAAGDFDGALQEAQDQTGRPTSNVIQAGLGLRGCSPEVIENGLTEAMLRELPRLERFLTALKVMAAVAPLLGLLGTVTGMINTFQVITAHGAGDPRLMAGGISEALITTQLGLAVAIPVLLAASLLTRKAQRITSDMEEKAVALTASLIQNGGGR